MFKKTFIICNLILYIFISYLLCSVFIPSTAYATEDLNTLGIETSAIKKKPELNVPFEKEYDYREDLNQSKQKNKRNNTYSYKVSYNGDGEISVKSSNPSVASVSYNKSTKYVTLQLKNYASNITITLSASEGKEYQSIVHRYQFSVSFGASSSDQMLFFDDLNREDWFYDAISKGYNLGLIKGYTNTSLIGPLDNVTRAQAITMLWRYFDSPDDHNEKSSRNSTPFQDNLNGQYYTDAINWGYKNNIITGYAGKNIFGVNDVLTRQQVCTIIARCSDIYGEKVKNIDYTNYKNFPDYNQTASYAEKYVAWAASKKIINGIGGQYLQPNGIVTRAQMVQFIVNARDIMDK